MSYAWITTLALHLLPILMIWRTWKSDWNAALEKIEFKYGTHYGAMFHSEFNSY